MTEVGPSPDVKTDEEPCSEDDRIEEEPDVSTYRHKSGESNAEDVDQHMAVLPDMVCPLPKLRLTIFR